MFIDEIEITAEGGRGGAGRVAFFAMRSGPSGGNGGHGGDVYATVNPNISDLKKIAEKIFYKAQDGESGGSNRRSGANGKDLYLQMPSGTTIIDLTTKEEVELKNKDDRVFLCHGGKGGLGNDAFKTSTNQTPRKAEPGEKGQQRRFKLILKLIADYGLIGLPNAGKSSLLNELTAAHVKTANYPFTTLEPNLGVYNGRVIADIPGLIEGASAGKGLGIKFLKHIEKVKLLLHCISVESEDIEKEYRTVIEEMGKYNKELLKKESIILLTKADLTDKKEQREKKERLEKFGKKVMPVSIYDTNSLTQLKKLL